MALCYKDRAFCTEPCGTKECYRRVTLKLIDEADEFGLPLAMMDLKCEKYTKPKLEDEYWPAE